MIEPYKVHEYRKRLVEAWESVTPASMYSQEALDVCQGRQHYRGYSSCADLAHFGYHYIGLRSPHINRTDGKQEWQPGVNVSRLAYWEDVCYTRRAGKFLQPDWSQVDGGDVLIRWSDAQGLNAHVVCVLAVDVENGSISTAEYGQRAPEIGRLQWRSIVPGAGERPWQVWLPLARVLEACERTED